MKKIVNTEIYEVKESSNIWTIPLIQGKVFYEVSALYDENKKILDVNYTVSESFGNIVVDFGYDTHIGYVKYAWLEYVDDDDVDVDANGSQVVNVNVTNENNCNGCDTNSELLKTVTLSNTKEFKIGELTDSCLMLDYCLRCSDGEVEGGRIVVINSNGNVRLDSERFMNSSLLDVSFSTNNNNDVINLIVQNNDSKTYNFKYKTIKF